MQVIPWEKSTIQGYKLCTGINRRPSRRALRNPKTNICIGIYELSEKRKDVNRYINWYRKRNRLRYCQWYNDRYWHWRHRNFFKRYPSLKKYFWVGAYNWGPRVITRNRQPFDTVGYPLAVLKCFNKYKL
jgi:hypothetical protein